MMAPRPAVSAQVAHLERLQLAHPTARARFAGVNEHERPFARRQRATFLARPDDHQQSMAEVRIDIRKAEHRHVAIGGAACPSPRSTRRTASGLAGAEALAEPSRGL